jgi:hypothetical protein
MRYFFQIGFAVLALWLLSGCAALVPLGEQGRLGYVAVECRYLPPVAWPDGRNERNGNYEGGWRK